MSPDPGLAAERTALAWQRTGMTTIGTGMAMLRLLPPSGWRPLIATAMVIAGAVTTVGARRMHPAVPHRRSAAALAAAVAVVAVASAVLSST